MKKSIYLFSLVFLILQGCDISEPSVSRKVITGYADRVTQTSAILYGMVDGESLHGRISHGMIISNIREEVDNHSAIWLEAASPLESETFSMTIESLSPGTIYYYRAWVKLNNFKIEYGAVKSFCTEGIGPDAMHRKDAFSISSTRKVKFAPGNLQYQASTNTWRFAEHQYDIIGDANKNISETYDGWIDLFGWGTGDNPANASPSYNDYASYVDWGTNEIDTFAPGTWRTLSKDEWNFLINRRRNASSLCGTATVNGQAGVIVVPDYAVLPLAFKPGMGKFEQNIYSSEDWAKLDSVGTIFLPAMVDRHGTDMRNLEIHGNYWTSTQSIVETAYRVYFRAGYLNTEVRFDRSYGQSVRLARDLP